MLLLSRRLRIVTVHHYLLLLLLACIEVIDSDGRLLLLVLRRMSFLGLCCRVCIGRTCGADSLLEPLDERAADNNFLAFFFFASCADATTCPSRCEDQVFNELLIVWIRFESIGDCNFFLV